MGTVRQKGRIAAFKSLTCLVWRGAFPILGLILAISVPLSTLPLSVFAPPIFSLPYSLPPGFPPYPCKTA